VLYLLCEREWDPFARRTRLRERPAGPAVAAVLLAGLAIPLMAADERTPPARAQTLAVPRPVNDPRRGVAGAPGASAFLNGCPWFRWPAVAGAQSYRARIYSEYDLLVFDRTTRSPEVRLRPPGSLDGGSYRLETTPLDAAGRPIGPAGVLPFRVKEPDTTLASVMQQANLELEESRSALVAAGYYAEHGTSDDVWAALEHYLELAAPGDAGVDVARRILAKRGR
jgi:hypothetical protein